MSIDRVVELMGEKKRPFLEELNSGINRYISSCSPGFCLTFLERRDRSERVWQPSMSSDYVRCLYAFCSNKTFNGNNLDSALTVGVSNLVVSGFSAFYENNSDEVSTALAETLLANRAFAASLVEAVIDASSSSIPAALKQQIATALLQNIDAALNHRISHAASHVIDTVTAKAVGVAVSAPISHATVTLLAKLLAINLKAVIAKVLASSAVHAMVAAMVKKYVIAALVAGFVHIIAAKLGVSVGAAFALVIVPIVFVYIAYEIDGLPKKLGSKVSLKVVEDLSGNFNSLNKNILMEVFKQIAGSSVSALASLIAANPEIRQTISAEIARARQSDYSPFWRSFR